MKPAYIRSVYVIAAYDRIPTLVIFLYWVEALSSDTSISLTSYTLRELRIEKQFRKVQAQGRNWYWKIRYVSILSIYGLIFRLSVSQASNVPEVDRVCG